MAFVFLDFTDTLYILMNFLGSLHTHLLASVITSNLQGKKWRQKEVKQLSKMIASK